MSLSAEANVDYDTNVARTSKERAQLQGIEPEDTIFTPSLVAAIVQPIGNQALFLNGSVSYNFHDKNDQLDSDRWALRAGGAAKVGPCGFTLTGGYDRGTSELDDYTLVNRVENVLTVKRVLLDATCQRSAFGVNATVSKDWGDNSLAVVEENDYETFGSSVSVFFSRPTFGSLGVFGNYSRTKYPNRFVFGQEDGFDQYGAGVRFERRLGARINADASLSYSWVSLLATRPAILFPDANQEFSGLTYSANIDYRASSRITTQLGFQRELVPTLIQGRTYEVQTNFDWSADYRIGSRLVASLGALQRKADTQAGIATNPFSLTDSRTRAIFGSLRYRQSERLSFVLSAQHEKRKADNSAFDYSGERYGLAAAFAFF
jgi:hypothetical protein